MKIDENIIKYCKDFSTPDEHILDQLTEHTFREIEAANMISGNMVGNLLYIICKSVNAKRVLDVGMFTGYSAIKLASAIPSDGEVHTFELAENHIKTAQKFIADSNYNNITIHEGEAVPNLETLENEMELLENEMEEVRYIQEQYVKALVDETKMTSKQLKKMLEKMAIKIIAV